MRNIVKTYLWLIAVLPVLATSQQTEGRKCTTFDRFLAGSAPGVSGRLAAVTRPERQTSILTPSKRLRIHFDTTGSDAPALVTPAGDRIAGTARKFADSAAAIFDAVWSIEVSTFGFTPPAADNGEGGGGEFDVYIQDQGPNNFGYTDWDLDAPIGGTTGALRYAAFIIVDNDFGAGFRTKGMDGLRAVAAHEFFHAVQVGGYAWRGDDIYFYELTAEAMEPTVFPSSKDYINDIATYFRSIETTSLYASSPVGYERAVWGIFLMKRYGVDIMRQMWAAVAEMKPLPAMKTVLEKNGTSMAREFAEFSYWNYFTGARADSVKYYADARLFPPVNIRERRTLSGAAEVYQYACRGFGVNYLQAVRGADTASFIIANVNMDDALGTQSNSYGYQLRVSFDAGSSAGWKTEFTVSDPANWKFTPLVNAVWQPAASVIGYPNPFRPDEHAKFYIGPIAASLGPPRIAVYSAGYDLVYSGVVDRETVTGGTYAVWPGKNSRGEFVATGVYIYMLSAGDAVVKGKIAVIR